MLITFPDGSGRDFPDGSTPAEIAASISASLAKRTLLARVNGRLRDASRPIESDCSLVLLSASDPEGIETIRHDAAHIMAQAVQSLFPGTQVTIGPVIEDGFYYDFARDTPFSTEDFPAIERKMHAIIEADYPILREVWPREQAIEHFRAKGEAYKAQIIEGLPQDEAITVYRQGEWLDLCRGPHLPSTGRLPKAFKLMKLAGAYWRGDSRNEMLHRIYGTAWANEKALKAYLTRLEEAEKRDHRRLGRQTGLFHLQSEAMGSVFWHPKGTLLWREVEAYMRRRLDKAGYREVRTPQLLDKAFWEQSGHWEKFRDNMFIAPDMIPSLEDEDVVIPPDARWMAIKPMNCPAHVQIFRKEQRSWRDLPLRLAEFGCCHRNEAHGALHGLMRVRQMTQDDAHIFCSEAQIADETGLFCELLQSVYADFGFAQVQVKLATRPDTRAGDDALWDRAEAALEAALDATDLDWSPLPGEGAFYGPKLEFHLTDAIGRSWQCGTLQLDFVLPERLDACYTDKDGEKKRPVMLHRAVLGTLERFIGILLEHYSGALPLWLSPVQIVVATIISDADDYAAEVVQALRAAGLRAEPDLRNEKINYKIREHSVSKIPVIAVVGRKESEERKLALRRLGGRQQEIVSLDEACAMLTTEATPPDGG